MTKNIDLKIKEASKEASKLIHSRDSIDQSIVRIDQDLKVSISYAEGVGFNDLFWLTIDKRKYDYSDFPKNEQKEARRIDIKNTADWIRSEIIQKLKYKGLYE